MKLLLISLVTVLFSASGFAGEFYVLEADDAKMQGTNTIGIKRMMRQQHSGVNLRDADLMSVMMVAKSRQGGGRAQLRVGQNATGQKTVGGSQSKFKSIASNSFDRVLFKNPTDKSNGAWQMRLSGNFKVRQLVVELGINGQAFELDYNAKHVRTGQGDDPVLHLKTKARRQHGIIPRDYELEKVTVIAKSRRGRGTAKLVVGDAESVAQRLGGGNFKSVDPNSYDVIEIDNPKANSNGNWQVHLNGNIKVHQVILHLVEK